MGSLFSNVGIMGLKFAYFCCIFLWYIDGPIFTKFQQSAYMHYRKFTHFRGKAGHEMVTSWILFENLQRHMHTKFQGGGGGGGGGACTADYILPSIHVHTSTRV